MRNRDEEEVKFWNGINIGGKPAMGMFNAPAYWQRLLSLFGSAVVQYLPLFETSGAVAYDKGAGAINGAYTGTVTLNSTQSPGRKPAPLFGGGKTNLYSTALQSAFPFTSGALGLWFKPLNAGVLTDGTVRTLAILFTDNSNRVLFRRTATNGRIDTFYVANNVSKSIPILNLESSDWQRIWLSWDLSGDDFSVYLNGKLVSSLDTLGTWQGTTLADTVCVLGASALSDVTNYWSGYESDFILLNRPVTLADVQADYQLAPGYRRKTLSIIGDSISNDVTEWPTLAARLYNRGAVDIQNHAAAGATIAAQLAGQVTAAASDDADDIIIHMGTGDDNAGDMEALGTTFEAGIAALKVSNPRARIIVMGVLKRWTDNTTGAEVDKSNIRTMEIAKAASQSVTYWDTYTSPWVAQNQMDADGVHPSTAAGHPAIRTQVVALL